MILPALAGILKPSATATWTANNSVLSALDAYTVGCYKYSNGAFLTDKYGHDLTNYNTVAQSASGKDGYGANIVNSYGSGIASPKHLKSAYSEDFNFVTGDFGIALWVNFAAVNQYQGLVSTAYYNGTRYGYWLRLNDNGKISFYNYGNSSNSELLQSTGTVSAGSFALVGFTRISGVLYAYINGSASGSASAAGNINDDGSRGIGMGFSLLRSDSTADYCCNAVIDEVIITKGRGITSTEWTALYNSGTGAFRI